MSFRVLLYHRRVVFGGNSFTAEVVHVHILYSVRCVVSARDFVWLFLP